MTTNSVRRRLAAVLVLPLLLVLAGCGSFTADFEVTSAESMTLSFDMAVDPTYLEGTYSSAEEMCADTEDGEFAPGAEAVEVEAYEEDGLWGCRASGAVDMSQLGSEFSVTEEDGEIHLTIDMGDSAGLSQEDLELVFGDAIDDFEFRVSFTFPGDVIESRGGTIDGNTVTYTDIIDFTQGVDITAEAGGGFGWLIIVIVVVVLGFLLLLAIAAVIFFVMRSRKKGGSGTPGAPGGYGGVPAAPMAPSAPQSPAFGQSPPPAPQQGQGQQWGQSSPPLAPPAPQQPWGQPGQQGQQPWNQPPGHNQQYGQNQQPGQNQNPGW
ncbi:hypothetical protein V1260_08355 [Brachybacterium sp. J144]|uniref:LppM family (lipo)protein n=1 Tax=Brachybacterium sp. J144 TaxID=3116487 RepID=UPI002E7793F4|nr:hypothetical protein [Brachybacterium sp. J144]MEE1650804.1 hypothetical protein [Brachybacterium sp. J144]